MTRMSLALLGILVLACAACLPPAPPPKAGRLHLEVLPKHVYAASDPAAPRWWFLVVAINGTKDPVTLERVRTTLVGPEGQEMREQEGKGIRILQGTRRVAPFKVVVLEVKDGGKGPVPTAAYLECTFAGPRGKAVITRKRVLLEARPTLYLRFPLEGRWATGNGREMQHGLGRNFALDFCREEDWPIHEAEPKRRFRCEDFAAFGQPICAPAAGEVVACQGERPDETPTPGKASYGSKPPKDGMAAYVGNYVALHLDSGQYLWMAHCRQGSLLVKVGDRVREGQPLAQVGNSGNTSGPHLHLELVDVMPDLAQIGGLGMPASGLPLGFKNAACGKGGKVRRGNVVPARREVIEALPADQP